MHITFGVAAVVTTAIGVCASVFVCDHPVAVKPVQGGTARACQTCLWRTRLSETKGVRCNCNCAVHLLNHLCVEQRLFVPTFRALPAQTAVKMEIRCIVRTMYVWNKTHVFKNYSLFCSYILFFLFPVESTWHKIAMTMAKMQIKAKETHTYKAMKNILIHKSRTSRCLKLNWYTVDRK